MSITTASIASWPDLAACRDISDPEIMFPLGEDSGTLASKVAERAAKTVCATCPVRGECLAWALNTGQDNGVWGGFTSGERRALHR